MIDFIELPSGLLMAKTPITQAQYRKVMGYNPSAFRGDTSRPVEQVSWVDAMEFCSKTGTRLPTEEEWEYAYRAGTNTTWYNGDDESKVGDIAWFDGNSAGQTQPVGQKQPNTWGLHDMAGNVWEWCADSASSSKVLRGGSWFYYASCTRAAFRDGNYGPAYRYYDIGFRVVKV